MTGEACFAARLDLFQTIIQYFQQRFNLSQRVKRDQGYLLYGRLTSFLYCLLGRILSEVYLASEGDWERLHEFDFTDKSLLGLSDFMRKTRFRISAVGVAKVTVDM